MRGKEEKFLLKSVPLHSRPQHSRGMWCLPVLVLSW